MIHCEKCLAVFTNSVGSGTVLCKKCQAKGDPDIFDTQPTCGELSCDECNERYAKAVARISALEAERDKAVELLRESLRGAFESEHTRPAIQSFLASIGGEGK